ncbi:MAG: aminotransferase class III-fold pyridoxal phosphate-dependent enzyme [Bauldia sp.]
MRSAGEGFLETLRDLCTRHHVPLVFDEVKSGFRHHVGGYQAVCGVTPDVTTFSKALGNGYTIAGLAGSADLMDHFKLSADHQAVLDGTHNAQPYALAASRVTLAILRAGGIERLYKLGEMVREGLRKAIRDTGTKAVVAGIGSSWIVYFRETAPRNYREALESDGDRATRYSAAMRDAGILEPLSALGDRRLCMATTEDDVREATAAAAVRALRVTA